MLRISEVFDSLQGEGPTLGNPCRFLRLALCNLHCTYCDTKYTWDFDQFDYQTEVREVTPAELAPQLADAPGGRLVITGGEPLLQQRALEDLLSRLPQSLLIEVETNGTRAPTPAMLARVNQWNVSPKLSSAGDPAELRLRPEALLALRNCEHAYLKIVVAREADRDEAEALRAYLDWPRERTLLMPEATTPDALYELSPRVAAWSRELGARFTTRLHVSLWGGRRGT
jgi:organic radical activating enzyme